MSSYKVTNINLMIALCFAILQALLPFMHAHLDADYQSNHGGLHVHQANQSGFQMVDDHEEHSASLGEHLDTNLAFSHHDISDVISIDSSLKYDSYDSTFVKLLFGLLLIFCFALCLHSTYRLNPSFLFVSKETLRRKLPASRAPPK